MIHNTNLTILTLLFRHDHHPDRRAVCDHVDGAFVDAVGSEGEPDDDIAARPPDLLLQLSEKLLAGLDGEAHQDGQLGSWHWTIWPNH